MLVYTKHEDLGRGSAQCVEQWVVKLHFLESLVIAVVEKMYGYGGISKIVNSTN